MMGRRGGRHHNRRRHLCAVLAAVLLLALSGSGKVYAHEDVHEEITAKTPKQFYDEVVRMVDSGWTQNEIIVLFDPGQINPHEIRGYAFEKGGYELEAKFAHWAYSWKEQPEGIVVTFKTEHLLSSLQNKQIDMVVTAIAEDCRNMTDYEKIKYAYDYLILNCERNAGNVGIYHNLILGSSDSNGYAEAFLAIMHKMNIPCRYTYNAYHAWNTVCLNGAWYNLDASLGDAGGDRINYDYFLKNNKDWIGMQPVEGTAFISYHASSLEKRASYPDYKIMGILRTSSVITIPAALFLILLIAFRVARKHHTNYRIARNEQIIKNLYKLPDE